MGCMAGVCVFLLLCECVCVCCFFLTAFQGDKGAIKGEGDQSSEVAGVKPIKIY